MPCLKPFRREDYPIFERYRSRRPSELAHTAFQPHVIWSDLLTYQWTIFADSFCLFATAAGVTHLACPPLGAGPVESAVARAFQYLAEINPPSIPPRMDHGDEQTAKSLAQAGYILEPSSPDYVYRREAIVRLTGNRFRSQRAAVNQSSRHPLVMRPFMPDDFLSCMRLFEQWAASKTSPNTPSSSYEAMMREDAHVAHKAVLQRTEELSLIGRVVCRDRVIVGYTFGFWLFSDQFCVLVEIADQAIRGLSAWLFHEFCKTLDSATWINAMDDSGLPSLAQAKKLWHPDKIVSSYTVRGPLSC